MRLLRDLKEDQQVQCLPVARSSTPKVGIQSTTQGEELPNLWKDTSVRHEASTDDLPFVC